MKKIFSVILLIFPMWFYGQTVSGTVKDPTGIALPGVNIIVKNTTTGTQTDFDGNYTINVTAGEVLVYSFIGFGTQEVVYTGQGRIDITLEEEANALDDVIVVGYGTSSRAKISTAISSVNSEEIIENPTIGIDQALQGRAAGVTVQSGGNPGRSPAVRIRGLSTFSNGDPLYVVDGVFIDDINNINPSSIESVDILKDAASAAIYGSRGSNGVILITTKKGKAGWSKLGVNTYSGFQNFNNKFDLLNAQEYRDYALAFGDLPPRLVETQYAEEVSRNDTDWQDEIFETALMSNIDVNYSGGSDDINYYMYGGYFNQEGVIINTGFDRYTFGINSDLKLSDKIKIGETLGIGLSTQDQLNQSGGRTLIEHAIKASPLLGVFEPGTENFQGPANRVDLNDAENPVRVQTLQERINRNTNLYGSIYGEYEFLKGLKFRQQVGVNLNYNNNDYISRRYSDGDYSNELIPTQPAHAQINNRITKSQSRLLRTVLTSSLTYDVTFGVHNLTATAVYEKLDQGLEIVNTEADAQDNIDQLTNTSNVTLSTLTERALVSYIGRVNYDIANKYLFTGSIRRDGSSRFGPNFRWGNFPAASVAWRVSEEGFLRTNNVISELKLRASYGVTGNDDTGLEYAFQSTIGPFGSYIIGSGNELITNNVFSGFANADLKWEQSIKTNFGFDLGLFDNAFTLTAEYFTSRGEDLLFPDRPTGSQGVPNTTANEDFSAIFSNFAEVNTEGFEFEVGYNDTAGNFQWSVNANLSTSRNEVLSTGITDLLINSRFEQEAVNIVRVGDPILSFFGWKTQGLFQNEAEIANAATQSTNTAPGDIRFEDINRDGVINDEDRTIIGNPFPDFTYGLNLNASYKGLDFVANLYGVQGVDIFNSNLYDLEGSGRLFNAGKVVLDAWTPDNTDTSQPRVVSGDPNRNVRVSDRYIEDGSFLRVKNLTLGYSLSEDILQNMTNGTISKMRLYVQGQNLFTFTDYKGYDPEVPARRQDFILDQGPIVELGLDRGFYPTPRTFLMGLQLEF